MSQRCVFEETGESRCQRETDGVHVYFTVLSRFRIFKVGCKLMDYLRCLIVTVFVILTDMNDADAIDCYVCTSIDRSDTYCEDTFNTSYPGVDYLQRDCMGYRKERRGYFPADHCIKISGVSSKNYSHTIMIRTCALDSGTLTADTEIVRMSHCGHFIFDGIPFNGCVQSCQTDGCNGAVLPRSVTSFVLLFCVLLVSWNKLQ